MLIIILTCLLLLPSDGTPLYPLYAIESHSEGYPLTDSDYRVVSTSFSYIHGRYTTEQLQQFSKANPNFKVVSYINSGIASSATLESAGRLNASYYLCGQLKKDLSPTDSTIIMSPSPRVSVLKPSTTNGNVSSSDGYVTFLRVEKELMKILKDQLSGRNETTVTVERGFANTPAEHHNRSSLVLCPVYHSDNYPGGNSKSLIVYTLDPSQKLAVNMLVNHTLTSVQQGYNGSWFDLFSSGQLRAVDMGGQPVHASWDFKTSQPYTKSALVEAQKDRLTSIYSQCHAALGQYPSLLANNVAGSYWPDDGDAKQLVEKTASFRPLDGYSLESFSGYETAGKNSTSSCGPAGLVLGWQPFDKWLRNVQIVMDAAQSNVPVFPMTASAGCESIGLELVSKSLRDKFESFAYSSYLLAVECPSGATRLGLPAFYQSNGTRYAYLHPRYSWPIGTPTRSVKPQQLTDYQPHNHVSFMRPFTNGLVVVNPHNQTDHNLSLNGNYHDPMTGNVVTSLTADSLSGYIFLNKI